MVAEMNKVIEVGVQLISQRNGRNREIEILEDSLKSLDDIYELEMSILGNIKVAEPPTQTMASRKRRNQVPDHASSRPESSGQDRTKRKSSNDKSNRTAHSPTGQSSTALDDPWGSSSPATFLPGRPHQSGSDDEGSIGRGSSQKTRMPPQQMNKSRLLQSGILKKAPGQTRELSFAPREAIAAVEDPARSITKGDRIASQASRLEKVQDDRQSEIIGAKMRGSALPARSQDKPSDTVNEVVAQKEPSTDKRKHRQSVAGPKRGKS